MPQMGQPAQGLQQAPPRAGRHPQQARGDDPAHGERAELAGEHHVPDVQYVVRAAGEQAGRVSVCFSKARDLIC